MEIFLNTRGTYPALSGYRLTAVTPMASTPLSKPSEARLFFGFLGRCTMMDALDQAERCRSRGSGALSDCDAIVVVNFILQETVE